MVGGDPGGNQVNGLVGEGQGLGGVLAETQVADAPFCSQALCLAEHRLGNIAGYNPV